MTLRLLLIGLTSTVASSASAAPLVADNGDDVTTLAAFCKQLDPPRETCSIADADKILDLAKPVAPYLAARLFWAGDSITTPNNDCYIGLQTKQGFTVASLGTDCWGKGKYSRRFVVRELAVRAPTLLWLRYAIDSSDPDWSGTSTNEFLVICGMAQDRPRCTSPIELGLATDGKPIWRVKVTLTKTGSLTLALDKGKRAALPAETAALLGKTTLAFE